MFRTISILLWALVVAGGIYLWLSRPSGSDPPVEVRPGSDSGLAMKRLPWKHLGDIKPFRLTESTGKKFDSRELAGHAYVVNFFYSTCPTICRQFNNQVKRLSDQFADEDVTFLSITVDPEVDDPERLSTYAEVYERDPQKWKFLTGDLSSIQEIGQQSFRVVIDKAVHTESLLLVDRWGRYRDRFNWDDPEEMERFKTVVMEVVAESEPPLNQQVETRNLLAGTLHSEMNNPPWLDEFFLTRPDGATMFSRDLTGEVWIASVFFSTCTTHCVKQNQYLRDLQARLGDRPVRLISITTDPQTDTPAQLADYAKTMKADPGRWTFLTSDSRTYVDRVAAEFLGLFVDGDNHATLLVVIDKWGEVCGKFDWRKPETEAEMFRLLDELLAEKLPNQNLPD